MKKDVLVSIKYPHWQRPLMIRKAIELGLFEIGLISEKSPMEIGRDGFMTREEAVAYPNIVVKEKGITGVVVESDFERSVLNIYLRRSKIGPK